MIDQDWRTEDRHLEYNLMLTVYCRGEHSRGCQPTLDGYICSDDCEVEDMPTMNTQIKRHSYLIDVEKGILRRRWHRIPLPRVEWWVTSQRLESEYHNGRSRRAHEDIVYATPYRGVAWTRRRAELELDAAIESDVWHP